jgi:hypothetical protein
MKPNIVTKRNRLNGPLPILASQDHASNRTRRHGKSRVRAGCCIRANHNSARWSRNGGSQERFTETAGYDAQLRLVRV